MALGPVERGYFLSSFQRENCVISSIKISSPKDFHCINHWDEGGVSCQSGTLANKYL